MLNCLSTYCKSKFLSNSIDRLEKEESDILFKYLTLDTVARFSSPYAAFNPDFELTTNATARYDDRQFYAQIVNYLLINVKGGRHKPTLNSLQTLVENSAFGSRWSMSTRTFEKHWRKRAASCPFLYVEQFHSEFDWSLNPQDMDFSQRVDELMISVGNLRSYFSKVKWVIKELKQVLDSRATSRICFPSFPDDLTASAVENPPVDRHLQTKIAELL